MITKKQAQAVADTLLACPFCGGAPEVSIRGAGEYAKNPKARCLTDGCAGAVLPVVCLDIPEQVAAWNRRDKADPPIKSKAMTLREAAQAVIDRWETPLWKDVPATAHYIADLRKALAQSAALGQASVKGLGAQASQPEPAQHQTIALLKQALDAHCALREWIKAVPKDLELPAMPGVDGDWLDEVEQQLRARVELGGADLHPAAIVKTQGCVAGQLAVHCVGEVQEGDVLYKVSTHE